MRKSLLDGALTSHGHYPYEEPKEISINEDAGHVTITIGEGTLVFDAKEALGLGEAICAAAKVALSKLRS